VHDGTRLIFEASAPTAIAVVEDLVQKICWQGRDKAPEANPVVVTGTRQVRNKKNQVWWVPTLGISYWNEPDASASESPNATPQPDIETAPTPKPRLGDSPPSAEAQSAIGGAGPAARRERQPRNAYAHLHTKRPGQPTQLEDELDDNIPL
jgi:hypothetical protein